MRVALDADARDVTRVGVPMQLIEEMRTAIAKDQEGLGLSDAQLADLMRETENVNARETESSVGLV